MFKELLRVPVYILSRKLRRMRGHQDDESDLEVRDDGDVHPSHSNEKADTPSQSATSIEEKGKEAVGHVA